MARRGLIEVHAYCLMSTHFHLLVRIPEEGGDLSVAMMRIQNAYVRWFNRRNMRDGPLFRSRFGSKPVRTASYWLLLLRYIHLNPVQAGICADPTTYGGSSAQAYSAGRGPRWLRRSHCNALMANRFGRADAVAAYESLMRTPLRPEEVALVRARRTQRAPEDPTDEILGATPAQVREWMVRKAANADGLTPSLPLASDDTLYSAARVREAAHPDATVQPTRVRIALWPILRAGLLHELCGQRCEDVAKRERCATGTASRRIHVHRRLLREDETYAQLAAEVGEAAMRETYGALGMC